MADFEDVTYPEFIAAGIAIAPELEKATERPLGETILAAVEATRRVTPRNTNLGTILLLTPLAAVPAEVLLRAGVGAVLARLTAADARYRDAAIRLASPGGLGHVDEADVASPAPPDLMAAMRLGRPIAIGGPWQYADGFSQVFDFAAAWLAADLNSGLALSEAIIHVHLRLMSQFPDSLIARKGGGELAARSAAWAAKVLEAGRPGSDAYEDALADLYFWWWLRRSSPQSWHDGRPGGCRFVRAAAGRHKKRTAVQRRRRLPDDTL